MAQHEPPHISYKELSYKELSDLCSEILATKDMAPGRLKKLAKKLETIGTDEEIAARRAKRNAEQAAGRRRRRKKANEGKWQLTTPSGDTTSPTKSLPGTPDSSA